MRARWWVDVLWLVLLAGGTSVAAAVAGTRVGVTFDEPFYLEQGLQGWRTGSNKKLMTAGTMPLPVDVISLPAYLADGDPPTNTITQQADLIPAARRAALPFWWATLTYALLWGRTLGGPWAGRLAAGLFAADPSLLAHASLATTDIASLAGILAATYHWHVGRDGGWRRRVLVPGLLFGVALACKASALAYVPIVWTVLGVHHLITTGRLTRWHVGHAWAATARLRWDLVYAGWLGLAGVFAYCGCDWGVEPTFVKWAAGLPDGPLRAVMLPLAENLKIFTNAGEGLVQQVKHNIRGHGGAYILGTYHHRAVWYYFPVLLTIKLPVATLGLLAVAVTRRAFYGPAGWVALALLLFTLNARVQIGVRLVFPCVGFLLIAAAVAVARGGWWPRAVGVAAMAGAAVMSASVWPDGLRYVNAVWGGPARGPELVADSNYDWGQGAPELRAWWAANGQPRTVVWYYGADAALLRPPFAVIPVTALKPLTPETLTAAVGPDAVLAVNVGLLTACPDRRPEVLAVVAWLNALPPVGRTPTFVVFKLP